MSGIGELFVLIELLTEIEGAPTVGPVAWVEGQTLPVSEEITPVSDKLKYYTEEKTAERAEAGLGL